jgi:hypothetical protein
MAPIDITCGTRKPTSMHVDLDVYGTQHEVGSTEDERKRALELLVETMDDTTFASSGHRNDDAVNSCIALHVLGYDPEDWLSSFMGVHERGGAFFGASALSFMKHVHRVCRYLYKWGPAGNEGAALGYALD